MSGAHAIFLLHVLLASVRLEIHADQRFGADPAREVYEFPRADLVRFDAAPQQVEHRRAFVARPDALAPAIEIEKDSTPTQHRGRELAGGFDDVFAPVVTQMIPRCFN